jgi:hypothetical protein
VKFPGKADGDDFASRISPDITERNVYIQLKRIFPSI